MLILIGTTPAKQLPTIRSRCQLVRFRPLPTDTVADLLVSKELVADPSEAQRLAQYSDGSLSRALELADAELWSFRDTLYQHLSKPALDSVRLAPQVAAFIDEAGRAAPARRARFRQVVGFAAEFYRQLLHAQCGTAADPETNARRLDRCLDALTQIDRNANQSTLIECWLDDLARPGT